MNDTLLPVIKEQQLSIVASVETLKIDIVNADTAEKAGWNLGKIRAVEKELEDLQYSLTNPLEKRKKSIIAAFKEPKDKVLAVKDYLKKQVLRWSDHLEETQRKEQAELEAKAEAQQEAARAKLEAEARAVLEEDPFAFDEAEYIEMEAQTLCVPTPILPAKKTIPFNASIREDWTFEVTEPELVPRQFLIPNEKALGVVAREQKENASIPGVRFFAKRGFNARSA
jgi:hypothetical protein